MERYLNTKRHSHIVIYYPARAFQIARMTFHTGNYWHAVCGCGSSILGQSAAELSDAPERPLCKHCQRLREMKERAEA